MISISTLAILFVISIVASLLVHKKWKVLNSANSAYINKSKLLIKPTGIRAAIKKYGDSANVKFVQIDQSESGFLVGDNTLIFPIHGVNQLILRHEIGHLDSIINKKYRWIKFASKLKILRRISIAIGTDYMFEKEAWRRSGYLETGYAQNALKAYRYIQVLGMLDLISKILLTIIMIRLIF